jgi:hypothetical protein
MIFVLVVEGSKRVHPSDPVREEVTRTFAAVVIPLVEVAAVAVRCVYLWGLRKRASSPWWVDLGLPQEQLLERPHQVPAGWKGAL